MAAIWSPSNGTLTAVNSLESSHGSATVATTMGCYVCHNTTASSTSIDTFGMMNGTTAANSRFRCSSTNCHDSATVSTRTTKAGAIANKANHVNGQINVAFAPVQFNMKAQLRTSLAGTFNLQRSGTYGQTVGSYDYIADLNATSGTYTTANKTCTVACHMNQPVTWGDQNVTCMTCHTTLP
jgi:hypothetical protein